MVTSEILSREPEVLQAISELERATRVAISRRIHLSAACVDYLCIRLRNDDYISGNHLLGFKLTPKGEKQLERFRVSRKKKRRAKKKGPALGKNQTFGTSKTHLLVS